MIRASIVSSRIPMREWCFVVEHMSLVDAMTNYSTIDKSKTIFEAVYGFVPDVYSIPPIGCFACRLEETKEKSDRKLGIRNTPSLERYVCGFCYLEELLWCSNFSQARTHKP